jgi:hypothetical protein
MRIQELIIETGGVGKIVKGVNTTPDVHPGEIKRQAAKLGMTVDDKSQPPIANPDGTDSVNEKWTKKYKRSIDCSHPRGFSQRAHCAARKKRQAHGKTKSKSVNESQQIPANVIETIDMLMDNHGLSNETAVNVVLESLDESLRDWFREKWVRFGPDGKIRGACARGKSSEGKPKCLPQSKAHALGKKARAKAARRKRRLDPNPERKGKAHNVATKESVCPHCGGPLVLILENSKDNFTLEQLAQISDQALDAAYHYGVSTPGNNFGWQANLASAAYAKKMIDSGITDIEKIADAVHQGWNQTAKKFVANPDQFDDTEKLRQAGKLEAKLSQRAKLMNIQYNQLDDDEQEKDRVVARALLSAIRDDKNLSEKRDACYYKVKRRYKVWPSAYSSGALVQCRKKGAKNWGKSK